MSFLVDTHCHLFLDAFDHDRTQVLERAREKGVKAFINVGIDQATSLKAVDLSGRHQDIWATVGFHPHHAHESEPGFVKGLEALASSERVVAVGEAGLDYAKSAGVAEVQKAVFQEMIALAHRKDLPLIVHSRDAFEDTLHVLVESKSHYKNLRCVFHCFSYDAASLDRVIREGFHVSFTGNVTFKGASSIQEAVRRVPLDRFMVETDAPYLAPQPVRGKRNEPAFLVHLISFIARLRGMMEEEVMRLSAENAMRFFRLS